MIQDDVTGLKQVGSCSGHKAIIIITRRLITYGFLFFQR